MSATSQSPVPGRHVPATPPLTGEQSFQQWREGVASIFEIEPVDHDYRDTFKGGLEAYNLGHILVGLSTAAPLSFTRSRTLVSTVGVDHLLVQLYTAGECGFTVDGQESRGKAGDLVCFDLARPWTAQSTNLDVISLVVPRQLMKLPPGTVDRLGGTVLRGETALGTLLREHILTLARIAPRLTTAEAMLATDVTTTLIAAGLASAIPGDSTHAASLVTPSLQAIQGFVERNLSNPLLSSEMIARHFGLSRSALYRTFEPIGGIAAYVRDRRLDRAAMRLPAIGTSRGAVARLARENGFVSIPAFSRAFTQRFGASPRDALEQAARANPTQTPQPGQDWLGAWLSGLAAAGSQPFES